MKLTSSAPRRTAGPDYSSARVCVSLFPLQWALVWCQLRVLRDSCRSVPERVQDTHVSCTVTIEPDNRVTKVIVQRHCQTAGGESLPVS